MRVSGYAAAGSGACNAAGSVTLALGQTLTCTITVDDITPTLRVVTTVLNNSGGSAVAANFSAHVRQSGAEVTGSPQAGAGAPGTSYTLSAGTYAVTADGVAGYAQTGSGACNATGSVTLALGQDVTCTITVDDIAATLRVVTNVSNNSGGSAVRGDFDAHVKRNGTDVTDSPQPGAATPGPRTRSRRARMRCLRTASPATRRRSRRTARAARSCWLSPRRRRARSPSMTSRRCCG